MKRIIILLLVAIASFYCTDCIAQNRKPSQNKTTIQNTKEVSDKEVSDSVLLQLYRGARVTDVELLHTFMLRALFYFLGTHLLQ